MDTISHIILFTLVLLPPVYLQLLPFRNFISPYQKHFLYQGYSVVYIVETACLWFTVIHWDVSPTSWLSYKGFLSVGWIPYFLLNIYVIPHYLAQHIFILGMQTIYTICMHSIAINILLLLIPAEEFFLYLPIHFILYLILFCICLPIVYPLFTEIFSRFYTLNSEYLWKFICPLPLVLCINEAFFSMTIPPLSQKYVLPSLCLGIAGILIGVCVRTGLLQLEERIRLYKKNYALLVQLQSMNTYTQELENSQTHMSVLRHNNRHHLSVLAELIQQQKNKEALEFINTLNTAFTKTKIERFCMNPIINAALTCYINKARKAGIPVSVSLDIPPDMSISADLSIVLSNLIENAIHASKNQSKGQRSIIIIAKNHDHVLDIVVKNRYDGAVHFDRNGLPITKEKNHGLGMKGLLLFRDMTHATVLCNQKKGWFHTYLQLEWSHE